MSKLYLIKLSPEPLQPGYFSTADCSIFIIALVRATLFGFLLIPVIVVPCNFPSLLPSGFIRVVVDYILLDGNIVFIDDTCYVTLPGFVFSGVRIFSVPVPFHQQVPEINLRFYVKPKDGSQQDRGVVFIREIISKPFMALAANIFYKEHYAVWPVSEKWKAKKVAYVWHQPARQKISVKPGAAYYHPEPGSHEEFITMQLSGYTKLFRNKTIRYRVQHPLWKIYPAEEFHIDVDFKRCFKKRFRSLSKKKPHSVFLAEGSPIEIYPPSIFT